MIVDAHVHVGQNAFFDVHASLDHLVRLADRVGIDRLFATHFGSLFYDLSEGNAALAAQMKRFPDRVLGYCTIPSTSFGRAALDELERCRQDYGMHGVKLYSTTSLSIDNPLAPPLLERAAALGMPLLIHMAPQEAESLARQVPSATLIMAHMGGTALARGDWMRAIEAARRYPNIYLETSSSTVDRGMIETAVQAVGAERVVFGSDSPLLDPWVQLARITGAEIDAHEKELILGANILRLVGLGGG